MASPRSPKERDGVLATLDVFVQALNLAKDTCGVPPAQIAFGAASALLSMIRVRFYILCGDELLTNTYLGHGVQRPELRRTWAVLCWRMPNPLP
jgi:hypothetical protein